MASTEGVAPPDATTRSPGNLVAAATAHGQRGAYAQAEQLLTEALALDPDHAGALDVLGSVLRSQDRIEDALSCYQRSLDLDPLRVSALSNTALCMRDLGRFDEARAYFEQAVKLAPENPMIATNLAALLFDTGHFDEADAKIETVLRRHPDFAEAHVVRGTRLLRRGDFARGWADYEWRDRNAGRTNPDAFKYPVWDGSPVKNGVLLVCCEQGLGDQIMFASCIDDLLTLAPRCVIECDARLMTLFARSLPAAHFYVQKSRSAEQWLHDGLVPHVKTWLGSLPGRFRRQVVDFPQRASYLQADAAMVAAWKCKLQSLGTGPKIGISWHGGFGFTRRALRSIDLDVWLPLLRCPGMHFVSLQYGDCGREIEQVRASAGVSLTHWENAIQDYDQTAALVSALDLVISVQTAVVHLAGALGKPTWVLVPSVAEWRYGESGMGMPWYPSVRLYRQTSLESWSDVLNQVQSELERATVAGLKGLSPH
jgi:Flp pilus assembly protein TadD